MSAALAPVPNWKIVTDAPLGGLSLAREAGKVLAWDDSGSIYLMTSGGESIARKRAPGAILSAAISDDGSLVAALVEGRRLLFLNKSLEPEHERNTIQEAEIVAVDALGDHIAVASRMRFVQLYTRFGQAAGRADLLQPAVHLLFSASQPVLLAAGDFGQMTALALLPRPEGKLAVEPLWKEALLASIGGLAITGDMGMILAACHTHGIQRLDQSGKSEGSYHVGGSVVRAVPDFSGRRIVAATGEGELLVLNRGGNVRWKSTLPRPAAALVVDALGRYFIFGTAEGEIERIDLEPKPAGEGASAQPAPARAGKSRAEHASTGLSGPVWRVPIAASDDDAATMVLAVLDDPPCIGIAGRDNRLRIFFLNGQAAGSAPEILGAGRFLRTEPGCIAIGTDRGIALYDARSGQGKRVDLNLLEVTHLELGLDHFGLGIVQERDRLGRATPSGRWIWKKELHSPVEDAAIGPGGVFAVSTDDGRVHIFDAAGEPMGGYQSAPAEPLGLIAAPLDSPAGVVWLTLARGVQILRGHSLEGKVLWESPVPWESWKPMRLGPYAVVSAPDGNLVAYDGTGTAKVRAGALAQPHKVGMTASGALVRVQTRENQCICTDAGGQVLWRTISDALIGPFEVGALGVAVMAGRDLAWFPHPPRLTGAEDAQAVDIDWGSG